jgi:hypothetical protein
MEKDALKRINPETSEELLQKIDALFTFRKIPWLLEESKMRDRELLTQRLIDLQIAIYELDRHLESHWEIRVTDLKPYWLRIYACLDELGLSVKQQHAWSKEIVRYQNHELDLRHRKSPLRHAIEDMYTIKSCDVRLIRRLIYQADDQLNQVLKFSEWVEFDLVTEVNDDLEDLYEDLPALNGNRFLFSLFELGPEETSDRYELFLQEIMENAINRISASKTRSAPEMLTWVETTIRQTRDLLLDRMESFTPDLLKEARCLRHYTDGTFASRP